VRARFPALLLVCALALAGCTSLEGTGDKGFVSGAGQVVQVAADERDDPIELAGEDLEGDPLELADFRGEPVVVTVWGSWCAPCREEAPEVVAAAGELGEDAQFVGINLRDSNQAQAQGFVRTFDVPYPSFYSPDGKAMLAFDGTLTPNSIPSFVVLDEEGRVAASIVGTLPSRTTLVELVRDVMEQRRGARADG
jgi:thiol-disulfide isomerase/thioredoxin